VNLTAYQAIDMRFEGKVLLMRLNRPAVLNAIDAQLHDELSTVFSDIARDDPCEAIVLTGAGRAFCAGGDIKWFEHITPAEVDDMFTGARRIVLDLLELPMPIIAAVNGAAMGLGATMALFCDVVLAAESAIFGDTHVSIGLVAGDGGAVIWPWLIGPARAKEALLTGRKFDAAEAEHLGLVNHVFPAHDLLPAAMRLAAQLTDAPKQAVRGTKASINKLLRESTNLILDTSLALEKACFSDSEHGRRVEEFVHRSSRPGS
jgi:enoyl-CoA hydratase